MDSAVVEVRQFYELGDFAPNEQHSAATGFAYLDDHLWEVMWMDPKAAPPPA